MARGSKPGERRGGRQKGTPNKVTAEVKDLAAQYAPAAMAELGRLAVHAEGESARVAAIREILDRAYGRPAQAVHLGQDENAEPMQMVARWANSEAEATPDPSKL